MQADEIRRKFLEFFKERGHAVVKSSSLIPDDPSVLLTTAGMQQFKRYFTGELDPVRDFGSKNTVSIQKSFRTSDIDEVGDESHLTFFEMLGNFSFGGYFKREAIIWAHEFITKEMDLEISYVTVFKGLENGAVSKDEESKAIWRELGVGDIREEGMEDVFWGPTGTSGPCGPTTEIYVKNAQGRDIEIWNIVFNEFLCTGSREQLLNSPENVELKELPFKGIDTGMGLERLAMVSQKKKNIFETDLFTGLATLLPEEMPDRTKRIMSDHLRGASFLIADGVRPSNKEAGYVLRRLLRRVIVHEYLAQDHSLDLSRAIGWVVGSYKEAYPELDTAKITEVFEAERAKFLKTIQNGLKELNRLERIDAQAAFRLYESYGLPYEIVKELGGEKAEDLNRAEFEEEFRKHQELSRAGAEKKFGGHGLVLDTGELKAGNPEELQKATRLHTATHLLQKALREVLGEDVHQMGSDITPERTRFDFNFGRKLTPEEINEVEEFVNAAIREDLPVSFVEMPKEEAEKTGALYFFKEKYPERVKVYFVGPDLEHAVSKEFCGGPHVKRTGEIGKFRVAKEESVAAGVRRIKGVVEFDGPR